jgi:hypothetical protein
MLTQIYEVSTSEEALAISAIGVDHIGILVGDGEFPRELAVAAAAKIASAIVPSSKFSALFLTADIARIASWARELKPAIVHLGASAELLSPQDVALLKQMLPAIPIMRSVPVFGDESVAIALGYAGRYRLSAPRQLSARRQADRRARRAARLGDQPPHRRPRAHSRYPRWRPRTRQRCASDPRGPAGRRRSQD